MEKRWKLKEQPDAELALGLAQSLGVLPAVGKLLVQRGIKTPEEAEEFFNPDLRKLHDPYLMKDMARAVERVNKALVGSEKILVYGDYDVDGTTAVSLVYMALGKLVDRPEERLDFYIPDRYNEGYGISFKGIEYAHEKGFSLVIALDCGIKAVEKVALAQKYGIDVIICDHHNPGDTIPDVVACLDAKRQDCPYPDKNLSGCGVGFKLMEALYKSNGRDCHELIGFLDLLVISIASDIVPMTGENRILAYHGLRQLNSQPHVGIESILDKARLKKGEITISDIIFKIGPRINAAGRMGSGNDAVRLLVSNDKTEADTICDRINDSNDERKDLDREITREAIDRIEKSDEMKCGNSTVLYEPTWSKGVIGIVASRLTETYYRPTIILTQSQTNPTFATGSARSVEGFDLYKAIDSCSELLENFGGHTYAAGLTMRVENVEAFRKAFETYTAANLPEEFRQPQEDIDIELTLEEVSNELLKQIERFEPFGPANTKPVFVTRGVYDYCSSKLFGHSRQHIKLDMIDSLGRSVKSGVAFGLAEAYQDIADGKPFDVCYTLENNEHRGKLTLQMMIKDIHLNNNSQ